MGLFSKDEQEHRENREQQEYPPPAPAHPTLQWLADWYPLGYFLLLGSVLGAVLSFGEYFFYVFFFGGLGLLVIGGSAALMLRQEEWKKAQKRGVKGETENKPPWVYENWPVWILLILAALFIPATAFRAALFLVGVGATTYCYLKLKEWERTGGKEQAGHK